VIAGILATIMAGLYNLDEFRAAIDDLDPLSYLSVGYYGAGCTRWRRTASGPVSSPRRSSIPASTRSARGPTHPYRCATTRAHCQAAPCASRERRLERPRGRNPPAFQPGDRAAGRSSRARDMLRIPAYAQGRGGGRPGSSTRPSSSRHEPFVRAGENARARLRRRLRARISGPTRRAGDGCSSISGELRRPRVKETP